MTVLQTVFAAVDGGLSSALCQYNEHAVTVPTLSRQKKLARRSGFAQPAVREPPQTKSRTRKSGVSLTLCPIGCSCKEKVSHSNTPRTRSARSPRLGDNKQ